MGKIMAYLGAIVALASAAVSAQQQSDAGFRTKLSNQRQASLANIAGEQMQGEKEQEAIQLDEGAKADRASGQRDAVEAMRRAQLSKSRAIAVAGASGASALDPSVINLVAGFDSEGELAANTILYNANEAGKAKEYGGMLARNQGRDAKRGGVIQGEAYNYAGESAQKAARANSNATILSGVSSFGQDRAKAKANTGSYYG